MDARSPGRRPRKSLVWRLEFAPSALRSLEWVKKREPALFPRLIEALESLQKNPHQGKALKGELLGKYSYRVGSYRVIYKIIRGELRILVLDIGHRRDIYR